MKGRSNNSAAMFLVSAFVAVLLIAFVAVGVCAPAPSSAQPATAPKVVRGKLIERSLSEDEMFRLLTASVWENWPVQAKSWMVEPGADEDFTEEHHRIPDNLTLGADGTLVFRRPADRNSNDRQLVVQSKWNFKKTGPGSGVIFVQTGDAWRFAFLQDGSVSISGNRYWKGAAAPRPSNAQQHRASNAQQHRASNAQQHRASSLLRNALPKIEPSALYKRLTATDWYEQSETNVSPITMHFGVDGRYAERLLNPNVKRTSGDAPFPPQPFWSLETVPKPKVVFHAYDGTGYPLLAPWFASNLTFANQSEPNQPNQSKESTLPNQSKESTLPNQSAQSNPSNEADTVIFLVPGAYRSMIPYPDTRPPLSLSEPQMYKLLTSHIWSTVPDSGTKYGASAQNVHGAFLEKVRFAADVMIYDVPAYKQLASHPWTIRKDMPNGGWIFLDNGSALRFFLFRDGSLSLVGKRFFPTDKLSAVATTNKTLKPGNGFCKLTRTAWEQPNDFNGGPRTITFGSNGHYSEVHNGVRVEPKHYWSLNGIFGQPSLVLHDFEESGMNEWTTLTWKGDELFLGNNLLVPRTADLNEGKFIGLIANLHMKVTYARPLRDKQRNRLHLEFTRYAAGDHGFIDMDGLDKIFVSVRPVDSRGREVDGSSVRGIDGSKVRGIDGSSVRGGNAAQRSIGAANAARGNVHKRNDEPITIDLHGLPEGSTVKHADIDIYFDKTKPQRIRFFVRPKGIHKASTSETLLYQP